MEVHPEPDFYGDAVLPADVDADADDLDDVPQATLKLLSDFPEPLTEPQRRAVQHHAARQVRGFEQVRRQVAVVELGYLALLRLVKRLRREKAALQASLTEEKATATGATAGAAAAPALLTLASAHPPTTTTTTTSSTSGNTAAVSKEATAGPKRRPGGLLLRSSVFSGLQRVLQTAKSEQHDEKAEQLARQRERIAKESRLHLVSEDLAAQEALLEPLQKKYNRAAALAKEAADKAAPLLTLVEDMWRLEALYPSRFSMHAAGSLEPLMWAEEKTSTSGPTAGFEINEEGCGAKGDDGKQVEADEEALSGSAKPKQTTTKPGAEESQESRGDGPAAAAATAKIDFVVPFTPAQYTSEVEDAIRAQVEDVIDEYLAYRTRLDPVLYQLEQAQQAAKAHRVDQLMDLIGVKGADGLQVTGEASGASVAGAAGVEGTASGASGVGEGYALDQAGAAVGGADALAGKSAEALLHISSSEDEDDEDGNGLGGEMAGDAADKDRQDREQIRTALTALDDFEDA